MPRTAPSQTIEHRISLSNFERQQLEKYAEAYKEQQQIKNAGIFLQGVGVVGAGLGLYFGAKYIGQTWAGLNDKLQQIDSDIQVARSRVIIKASKWVAEVIGLSDNKSTAPYEKGGTGNLL